MPPQTSAFNDPNLTIVSIEDFTPGIFTFSRGSYGTSVSSRAPLGSATAFNTYRCYARVDYGLVPFPTYKVLVNAVRNIANLGTFGFAAMYPIGLGSQASTVVPDILAYAQTTISPVPGASRFEMFINNANSFPSSSYPTYSVTPGAPTEQYFHLNFTEGVYGANGNQRSLVCIDPTTTSLGTVGWLSTPPANSSTTSGTIAGTFSPTGNWSATLPCFFVNGRMCFTMVGVEQGPAAMPTIYGPTAIFPSDIQSLTSLATLGPEQYYPELGIQIGSWGSISDGEFFYVYQGGGGVIIYGDIAYPQSAVKLPGLTGTGNATGPAVETPQGLVYVTDTDGAWLWNGGNTATKISEQVNDDTLFRGGPLGVYQGSANPGGQVGSAHNDLWGSWVMFANNYMWDTLTGGWWKVEDSSVTTMRMHCPSLAGDEFFYSSDWQVQNNTGATANITAHIYAWDRYTPASTYRWTSTPIPQPGSLVSLEWVEICATNTTSLNATIKITPVGSPLLGNSEQAVTFNIPPDIDSWRGSMRLGYDGYNLQIQVDAAVPTGFPAPTLHEIHLGFARTRTSQVE